MISVDEALARILASITPLRAETLPLGEAAGRVLAAPVLARHNQPPFDASAMDGYAVRAADVAPGRPLRLIGTAQAGQRFSGMMGAGQCVRIFSGAPLPIGADTVMMQEEATANGADILFARAPEAGEYVRHRGRYFADGEELLSPGTPLTPARLALVAAANQPNVTVARAPRVALLATGDELILPGRSLGPDQIVASNNFGLVPLLRPYAAEVADLGLVPDDPRAIEAALLQAFDSGVDLLVTSGGASVGERDFVQAALVELGVTLDFWKIAMRPGKPLMFGLRGRTLIFGLPGNPVSALVTATILVIPALRALAGDSHPAPRTLVLPLAEPLPANGGRRHYIRCRLVQSGDITTVVPLPDPDSGDMRSLADADALLIQNENSPALPAGTPVPVILLAS